MKRINKTDKKRALAGGLIVATSLLSGCFGPAETVYGPPPTDDPDPGFNDVQEVYGPPHDYGYDPEGNIADPVYGPPPDEEEPAEESPEPSYDPAAIVPPGVYGPPM